MSKLKTRQAASKRYRKTKNKKFIYKHPFKAHILEKKSSKKKRYFRTKGLIQKSDANSIKIMVPY